MADHPKMDIINVLSTLIGGIKSGSDQDVQNDVKNDPPYLTNAWSGPWDLNIVIFGDIMFEKWAENMLCRFISFR